MMIVLGMDSFLRYSASILYLLPVPAVVDWALHRFMIYEGTNLSRVSTGFLLGLTFGALSHALLTGAFNVNCSVVSVFYATAAAFILLVTE
jgi:uncharacterized membrane protein